MEENKLNKSKLTIIAVVVFVILVSIIIGIISTNINKPSEKNPTENFGKISQTESEFEALAVKDIVVKYNEENPENIETKIDFSIQNKTDEKVEEKTIEIHLLDANNGMIAGVSTYVQTIDANGEHRVNMSLAGKIEGIEKIKLIDPNAEEEPAEGEGEEPAEGEETPAE